MFVDGVHFFPSSRAAPLLVLVLGRIHCERGGAVRVRGSRAPLHISRTTRDVGALWEGRLCVSCEDDCNSVDDALREVNVEKFIRAVRVRAGPENASDDELCERKKLAEHPHKLNIVGKGVVGLERG